MFYDCTFNNKNCSKDDFLYFYSTTYGNRYSFNSGYNADGSNQTFLTSSSSGLKNSLQLKIYLGKPSLDVYNTDGLLVSIDNQTIVPFAKGNVIQVILNLFLIVLLLTNNQLHMVIV